MASDIANKFGKACGVAYNLSDEEQLIRTAIEKKFDLDYVAQFADAVCRERAVNISWVGSQLAGANLVHINFTSFGNVAYIIKYYNGKQLNVEDTATILQAQTVYKTMVETVMKDPEAFIKKQHGDYQAILKKTDARPPKAKLHATIARLRKNRLSKAAAAAAEEKAVEKGKSKR